MNTVERVKAICAERGIAVSKLEKDLGFANAYIAQLRKGSFPAERLLLVSDYLGLSMRYLITGQEENAPALSAEALRIAAAFDKADAKSRDMVNLALREYMETPAIKQAVS